MLIAYKLIYYLVLVLVFAPYLVILAATFSWIISNQTNNLKSKKRATLVVLVALAIIYLFRFGAILLFSGLYNKERLSNLELSGMTDIFTLLQLLLIAFIPAFSIIQSYIFEYQFMITEGKKRTSASSKRSYLLFGIAATIAGVLVLQVFKGLFNY